MASLTLYGLPTCDTCRKARRALEEAGHEVAFRDVRAAPLSDAEWAPLLAEFGDALVNRKSTTWRGLSDWMKASEAEDQLKAHPALMKRPVIAGEAAGGAALTLGWDEKAQGVWGIGA
ncbi:MAG: ArsC/Spx/MgsR family protein [Pseudomonadota bacterium]